MLWERRANDESYLLTTMLQLYSWQWKFYASINTAIKKFSVLDSVLDSVHKQPCNYIKLKTPSLFSILLFLFSSILSNKPSRTHDLAPQQAPGSPRSKPTLKYIYFPIPDRASPFPLNSKTHRGRCSMWASFFSFCPNACARLLILPILLRVRLPVLFPESVPNPH